MNMKNLLPRQESNSFTGKHGPCFAGYRRGAQPEGWRFGTPTAPTELKPRPSRRSDRGSKGLLLGTPPSVRSPKVREDRKSRTLKPMPTTSMEVARLRVRRRRQDTKNTEADARSKRGGGQSSLFFGSEREDRRRPDDASIMVGSGQ